ncbi:MAG: ABC transporter substrate-binding protein, partial [Xanthobacteraceae bacterium]
PAAEPTLLHVNVFRTARSLPFYAGIDRGFFAKRGLSIDLQFTENSERQRQGLADGSIDIAHSAVDNAVAMIDVAKVDVVIVSGGDSGTNEFYVQDGIKDFADIRGHAIVIDATNTAYALQAQKILLQHGLKAGTDYTLNPVGNGTHRLQAMLDDENNAGAILNSPFSLIAATKGSCTASAALPTCSAPIRPTALSPAATGPAPMRMCWFNISRPISRRCAGHSIRRTMPKRRQCWSTSSS